MNDEPIVVTVDAGGLPVVAGHLWAHARRGTQSATFQYEETYLTDGGAFPLDPALPLARGAQQSRADQDIFNVFADTAPDRWGRNLMIRGNRRAAEAAGETARQLLSIDFVLGVSDHLRQGAVRLSRGGHFVAASRAAVPKLVSLPGLLRAADSVDDGEEISDSDLRDLLAAGGSLGGARPKAAVVNGHGRLCIAKFPKREGADEWDVIGWEKIALDMAAASGVSAAQSELLRIGGRHTLLLPRFDRDEVGNRIFYSSALTALESTDGESRSYLELQEWLESSDSMRAEADSQELWRRIAFSIAIGNTDDHLRNHGFLRNIAGPGWALSPAFDINPTPGTHEKFLQTAIDYDNREASFEVALSVADYFRLSLSEARAELSHIGETVSQWRNFAERNDLKNSDLDIMAEALDHGAAAARTAASPQIATSSPAQQRGGRGRQTRRADGKFGPKERPVHGDVEL